MSSRRLLSSRSINRQNRAIHLSSQESYLSSLPDFQDQDSDVSNQFDGSESEMVDSESIESTSFSESENESDPESLNHNSSDKKQPSKKDYCEAVLSCMMSVVGLNLLQASSMVNLVNNLNFRFSKNPVLLPSARYHWDKQSKENLIHTYLICDNGHSHGPFKGDPKDFGFYSCYQERVPATLKSEKFFLHVCLRRQFENHLPSIPSESWNIASSRINDDVSSATQAKKIKSSVSENGVVKLTLTIHGDEVQAGSSSTVKIFPIFISINEIQPEFRRKHFFLANLFVGKNKPSVSSFLGPLIQELKSLENIPVSWIDEQNKEWKCTFHLVCLIADAPMRAYLRSVRQFNHIHGCDWCLIKASSSRGARVFPNLERSESNTLKRKHSDFIRFADSGLENGDDSLNQRFAGLNGNSPFLELSSFDMVKSISVEPMHCLVLGIFRSLITKGWFGTDQLDLFERDVNRNILREALSSRLLQIKVPTDFGRAPRDLNQLRFWKSAEFDSFLVYYLFSTIKGLLKPRVVKHMMCLVRIYFLSHRGQINREKIDELRNLIEEFQSGVAVHYGTNFLTYNLHILTHMPDSLINLGPNSNVSSYPLEDYMGILKEKVRRSSNIAPSLVRTFINDFKYQEILLTKINDWRLNESEMEDFGFNKFVEGNGKTIYMKDKVLPVDKIKFLRIIREEISLEDNEVEFFKSVSINKKRFSSKKYVTGKKRNDSVIKKFDGGFWEIISIVRIRSQGPVAICRQIPTNAVKFDHSGFTGRFVIRIDHIHEVKVQKRSQEIFSLIMLTAKTKKAFYIPSTELSPKHQRDHVVDPFLVNV
ncbi:uncharacterized protein LOC128386873 [Panonychus citri]|uniref:uncharacterized protein LOC128386873 n=1 Tax=Panonychus citri TaxID=50023 RepID=UPI002307526D|nr:uncharacterized protein LOC128386873 [Panonychus citri]